MKKMWLALLLLAPAVGRAADISVGGVSLVIPNPDGFSPVTPQMASLYEAQKHFVAPTNEEFVVFIPERDVPAALNHEIPDLPRRFTVQTAKSLVGASVSTSDFVKLKYRYKTQNDEIMKKVEAQLPGWTKEVNEGITKKYNVDLAFSVSQMLPMPVHAETARTLAHSSLVKHLTLPQGRNQKNVPATVVLLL